MMFAVCTASGGTTVFATGSSIIISPPSIWMELEDEQEASTREQDDEVGSALGVSRKIAHGGPDPECPWSTTRPGSGAGVSTVVRRQSGL